jgi:adenylate cyclase
MTVYGQLQDEVQSKRQIQKLLGQFVATDVAEELIGTGEGFQVDGERVEASVLFVDIVNFTQIAEPMPPDDVANMLNRYLSTFAACARIYQGMVDKFIGDAAMIVFGTPRADSQHREHALGCALAIQMVARQINRKRQAIGLRQIDLRIGINSGNMRAGILGSEYRKEFTVVGDSVNLASRLCGTADPGQILVSENTIKPLSNLVDQGDLQVSSEGSITVKGKVDPVNIYQLVDIRLPKSWVLTNLIEDIVSQH